MRLLAAIIPALVAGCSSPARDAEERYEIVKRTGTRGEICAAGQQVAAAYLHASDEREYQRWRTVSEIDCQNAELAGVNSFPTSRTEHVQATRDAQAVSEEIQHAAERAVISGDK